MSAPQGQLFGPATSLPEGFVLVQDFIDAEEERALLSAIAALPLEEARYKRYTARRRIAMFEGGEDGVPAFLHSLRAKVAAWTGFAPDYGRVAGVSLGGWARMRLRPYPSRKGAAAMNLELAPRSAYRMEGPARWAWQHSIAATKALRYSITFRTLRKKQ